jgi:BirA family biotin operon repressor/biotin-[acetyl-CoA-carboxylase] ligase
LTLTQHTLADAVRAAGIDAPPLWSEVTGSTNTDLWRLGQQGAPEWTVVAAGAQEAGRGRLGRTWVSAPGASLHVSLLLRPTLDPTGGSVLTLAAGLALAEACSSVAGIDVGCKWPNDLVTGGRKLGGVLTEASVPHGRFEFVVVGTGVNLTQRLGDFPEELRPTATSVAALGGEADGPPILTAYLRALRQLYGDGGQGIAARTLDPYRERCVTLGRSVRATTIDGRSIEGVATGVAETGDLLVRTADGEERVGFGEVQHLR